MNKKVNSLKVIHEYNGGEDGDWSRLSLVIDDRTPQIFHEGHDIPTFVWLDLLRQIGSTQPLIVEVIDRSDLTNAQIGF